VSRIKQESFYICSNCGYQSLKWLGRCPDCGEWNSLLEQSTAEASSTRFQSSQHPVLSLAQVPSGEMTRLQTGIGELDRVLGGGMVLGSCVLISGEPGIGKSTLILQAAQQIADQGRKVLYASGEESPSQLKMRADRLNSHSPNLMVSFEGNVDRILNWIEADSPALLIVDSIQTAFLSDLPAAAGSIVQVRECASRLFACIKEKNIPLVLTGQVTKEGSIAGPKLLEHLVDVVLYFEGERATSTRLLRAQKNRFGDTTEIGLFRMTATGLVEVKESEHLFLEPSHGAGILTCALEGARVIPVEVQALVAQSYLSIPRRVTNGYDYNRFLMILAVYTKTISSLAQEDVYINVLGGFRLDDPASDLAVALAVGKNQRELNIPPVVALGELGLGGELRPVPALEKRMQTAIRLGFRNFIIPVAKAVEGEGVNVKPARTLKDAWQALKDLLKG
jgi:DNA repair protein RadA/Sms